MLMKDQIHTQLVQLATAILKENVLTAEEIKNSAQQLYEQATLLAYAENNLIEVNSKKEPTEAYLTKKENDILTQKQGASITNFATQEEVLATTFEPITSKEQVTQVKEVAENNEVLEVNTTAKENIQEAPDLLHELENLTQDFDLPDFEPLEAATIHNETPAEQDNSQEIELKQVSLNDTLSKGFNVGLNDRLAFTNQLFGGSQEDYTRVISQLNTTETLTEAQQFINDIIKPEYNNWEGKETFELRFLELIERNFQS